MNTEHDSNDGSDTFWPGYVDAVTNLVLNLLFLLTVMIVAVFMFALELGRSSHEKPQQQTEISSQKSAKTVAEPTKKDLSKENIALKKEIERLNHELANRSLSDVVVENKAHAVDVASGYPKPATGLKKALTSDYEVVVRFTDEAVSFTDEEHDRLLETLKPILSKEKTTLYVEVPPGFSEAKRMAFYRAMAVRNLLIEMGMSKESINVTVMEGDGNANASLVRVGYR